jgi:hypothetical protein
MRLTTVLACLVLAAGSPLALAATDASKQTLYIFFSQPGNFIAANFTGK